MPNPVVVYRSWHNDACFTHPLAQDAQRPILLRLGNDGFVTDRKHNDTCRTYRRVEYENEAGIATTTFLSRYPTKGVSNFFLSSVAISSEEVADNAQKHVTLQRKDRTR